MVLSVVGANSFDGFDIPKLIANILFGSIGFVAFVYGKKNGLWRKMALGALLIGYTFFISQTLFIYITGIALTSALYFWRE
ncbi:MAG: hypothetical protein HQL27_04620 [Candidatus Omnitrophica bacterium]|nr:hypothetical protein [Candidatus Omnitrophota bacterium]